MLFNTEIENIFQQIPLPILEVWGSFAYIIGIIVMLFAFGGFTFHTGTLWQLGREWKAWDGKSFISMGVTFILIWVTGFIGSFFVLVPGAQTFESLKDLTVFLCLIFFGYPALLVVPFAYGLSDFYEGIPLDYMADWWLGYFINPACFWLGLQLIGKCPDFRRKRTWIRYLIFVFCFMLIEPLLWGYICSGKFTTQESYYVITPALFFTTLITWCLAPFATLIFYPLVRSLGYFWAEIPGHVKQKLWGKQGWVWESGELHAAESEFKTDSDAGVPIRFFILAPFIVTVLFIMGSTAYISLKHSEESATKLAENVHVQSTKKLRLKLQAHLRDTGFVAGDVPDLRKILKDDPTRVALINRAGNLISAPEKDKALLPLESAIRVTREKIGYGRNVIQFKVTVDSARKLTKESWLFRATTVDGYPDLILLSAIPESFYLSGMRKVQSHSALVFAFGLVLVLLVVGVLGTYVIHPIRRMCHSAHEIASGNLSRRLEGSKLAEMNTLAIAFNTMAESLQNSFQAITEKENRLKLAVNAGNLGIWEWDIKTNWVYWSDLMFRHYDIDPGTSLSYDAWLRIVLPEDHEKLDHEIKAALRGEKDFNTEFRVKWRDGSIHVLRAHSKTMFDESGNPAKMIGINYDITERRMADKELMLYRNQLEEVVSKRTNELQELTEKHAKTEVYEKIAQIFLSMRDYTNSPLQVQKMSIDILKRRCPEQKEVIRSLEESVARLSSINRILSRLESNFPHTKLMSEKDILEYLDRMEQKT